MIASVLTALTVFIAVAPTAQAAPAASKASFAVSGLTSGAAGIAQTVKVTALLNGQPNPGYRGTVVFTSTDAQAALPAQYTFTKTDKGVHSFPVTLKTTGSRKVTATDAASSAITGSQTVTVSPAAAKTFVLSSLPAALTAGAAQSIALTVRDAFSNVATGYRGTVHLTSSDPQVPPANYTFTAGDAGSHAFGVTLKTAGSQTVTLSDTATATLFATSTPAEVSAASATSLTLAGLGDAAAGASQSVVVTVRDQYGNVAKGYTGTVHFSSNDPAAALPSDYPFTAADAGSRSFNVTLKTAGQHQSVSVTDRANSSLSWSQTAAISGGPAVALDMSTNLTGTFRGSAIATAGQTFNVILTAIDAYGNTATGYTGTVNLTSTDARTQDGTVQFRTADDGRVTQSGIGFYTKKIYEDHASLTAVDTSNSHITAGLTFQVLPGPAVSYSPCAQPLSKASGYQQVNAPIGVNDQLGLDFTALDAYGNNATNREPLIVLGGSLPHGYEATFAVTTSDAQAVKSDATFTGSPLWVGPPIDITLRTAGVQTVTITDPNNPSLTRTCSYTVVGPQAYTGTITVADPNTTGNTTTWLPASNYTPPNDTGVHVVNASGPYVDDPTSGLRQLGTVEPFLAGNIPFVAWNLDPALPPPGTITCGTLTPCQTSGPMRITYTIHDDYGNTSAGIITVNPFHAALSTGNITYSGNQIIISGTSIPLNTQLPARIVGINPGTATVQLGDNASVNIAAPSTSGLVLGGVATVTFQQPLVISGNVPGCTPAPGVNCFPSSFVSVSVIQQNTSGPSNLPGIGIATVAGDSCGVLEDNLACPTLTWSDSLLPPPLGVGPPPIGTVGTDYGYLYEAHSPLDEGITFSYTGDLPPGLALEPNGRLLGRPQQAGIFSFTVTAKGTTSGSTVSVAHSVIINN